VLVNRGVRAVAVDRHEGSPAVTAPEREVARDAEQERRERAERRVVAVRLANEREKDLLRNLFGGRRRARHSQRAPVDRSLPPPVERDEGVLVPAARLREEVDVGSFVESLHVALVLDRLSVAICYSANASERFHFHIRIAPRPHQYRRNLYGRADQTG